jgi:hypothetical protein
MTILPLVNLQDINAYGYFSEGLRNPVATTAGFFCAVILQKNCTLAVR